MCLFINIYIHTQAQSSAAEVTVIMEMLTFFCSFYAFVFLCVVHFPINQEVQEEVHVLVQW